MNKKQGKKNRETGRNFELEVRKDLESKGWIVCRFDNNVENNKIVQAKKSFNPFTKRLGYANGFPDFICFTLMGSLCRVMLVECKVQGCLSREEKDKVNFLKCKGFIVSVAYKDNGVKYESY